MVLLTGEKQQDKNTKEVKSVVCLHELNLKMSSTKLKLK